MNEYYEEYVRLCLCLCLSKDYGNKNKVNKHNRAMRQLYHLQQEIREAHCDEILQQLLQHEDERVKINAAHLCLQMNVYKEDARVVLQKIKEQSTEPTLRFDAMLILTGA